MGIAPDAEKSLPQRIMEAMVEAITGVKALSLHRDISTVTGEEVVLFTSPSRLISAK